MSASADRSARPWAATPMPVTSTKPSRAPNSTSLSSCTRYPDGVTRQHSTWKPTACASWHRHACIVIARAGIADLLDAHPSDEHTHLGVRAKLPDGWRQTTSSSPTLPPTGCKRETSTQSCSARFPVPREMRTASRSPPCALGSHEVT